MEKDKLCKLCGNEIPETSPAKGFCSWKCYEKWGRFNKTPNCSCSICGIEMYMKPSRLKRAKNGITCSKECANKLKSEYMAGEGNHQFGLIGDKNASFKGYEIITNYGYILEYAPGHPFPHDKTTKGGRVFQHRLVVEKNYKLFDKIYFLEIDGNFYLNPEFSVHHINENKKDNRIENLQILTKSEHTSLHNKEKEIIRDNLGRIIGVVKLGKNGEA